MYGEHMEDLEQFIKDSNWETIFRYCNSLFENPSDENIQKLAEVLTEVVPKIRTGC